MRHNWRWCGWCLAVGVTLFLVGVGAAAAEMPSGSAEHGPSWQVIATVLGGFAISLVGAYARGIDGRVKSVEDNIQALRDTLFREHFTKGEVKDQLADIKQSLASLHRRLDYMHVPNSRPPLQDDGA